MYTQQELNQANMLKFEQVKQLLSTMPATIVGFVISVSAVTFLEWDIIDNTLILNWLAWPY
jgi:hypothetical protein